MTLPISNNYTFIEDKTIIPGQYTKGYEDPPGNFTKELNQLPENTDYLKEAKMWGFNGNSDSGTYRQSNVSDVGCFHIVKEIPEHSSHPTVVLDASQGLPNDSDGMKYRLIALFPRLIALKNASTSDTCSYIPGDLLDDSIASNKTMPGSMTDEQHTFNHEFLYTGEGVDITDITSHDGSYQMKFTHAYHTASIDLHFWVKKTDDGDDGYGSSGDLMCLVNEDTSSNYDQFLLILTAIYGPKWEEIPT